MPVFPFRSAFLSKPPLCSLHNYVLPQRSRYIVRRVEFIITNSVFVRNSPMIHTRPELKPRDHRWLTQMSLRTLFGVINQNDTFPSEIFGRTLVAMPLSIEGRENLLPTLRSYLFISLLIHLSKSTIYFTFCFENAICFCRLFMSPATEEKYGAASRANLNARTGAPRRARRRPWNFHKSSCAEKWC